MSDPRRPDPLASERAIQWAIPLMNAIARYHRYEMHGVEYFPSEGPVVMAMNHSLASYDGMLGGWEIFRRTGRMPVGMGDNLIFRSVLGRSFAKEVGIRRANPKNARRLLNDGHVLGVAPGGMREALRPSSESAAILWDKRKGFVRLAIEAGAPIVLGACPAADRLFTVYENDLTKSLYHTLKFPFPIFRGWGPTLIPRPVRLTHLMSRPISPPTLDPNTIDEQVDTLHREVMTEMERLMGQAEALASR